MSAGGFDLITPGRDGLVGLTMDPTLPKRKRGLWLLQAGEVRAEKDKGLQNPQVYLPSDPANAYLWPSDPRKMAPRGTASSWSTAFPGLKRKTGQWLPLESAHAPNEDYRERPADLVSAVWYGGELPGNTSAVLLPNTSHEKPGLLAYPGGGPIVSHHLGNQPPKYSRWFWDIKGDEIDPDRGAGAHTFTRVRRMPRAFCTAAPNPRQTVATPDPAALPPSTKFNAVMLNGTKSAGDHTGWLSTHFATADAALSHEPNGPLRASSPKHLLAKTEDGDYRAGAIDLGAYFSDGTDPYTGPLEFLRTAWEEGSKGNIIKRVELRPDGKELHAFRCGPRKVVWKWQTWDTWEPPSPITPRPKDKPPRDPVTGPDPTTFLKVPAPDPWPDNSINGDPHTTSSYEAAAPSIYGIAMPGLPDGSNRKRNLSLARSENERQWLAEIGMTPAEFHGGKHATVHLVFTAQHSNATVQQAEHPADRWPVASSQKPEIRVDRETGRVLQSRMGFAPGALVVAAGDVPRHKVYRSQIANVGTPNAHSLVVLNGATSGGLPIHYGRLGLGLVKENYAHVVAGWEALLDFSRQSDEDNPDLILRQVDEEGAPASSGQLWLESALRVPEASAPGTPASGKVVIYAKTDGLVYSKDDTGTETLMSGGAGGIGGSTGSTDNAILRANGTGGSTVQSSGLIVDDDTVANVPVHTPNVTSANSSQLSISTGTTITSGNSGNISIDVGSAAGTAGSISIGATNATAIAIGRTGITTMVNGPLASGAHTITQATVGNTVQQLKSTATNDDPTHTITQHRTTSSGTTPADITIISSPTSGKSWGVRAIVNLKDTGVGTSESGTIFIEGSVRDHLGATTISGQNANIYSVAALSTATAVLAIDGSGNVVITVTGVAGYSLVWHAHVEIFGPTGS